MKKIGRFLSVVLLLFTMVGSIWMSNSLWNSLKQDGLVDGDKHSKMLTVESR